MVIASRGEIYIHIQYYYVLYLLLQNKGGSIVLKIEIIVQPEGGKLP